MRDVLNHSSVLNKAGINLFSRELLTGNLIIINNTIKLQGLGSLLHIIRFSNSVKTANTHDSMWYYFRCILKTQNVEKNRNSSMLNLLYVNKIKQTKTSHGRTYVPSV